MGCGIGIGLIGHSILYNWLIPNHNAERMVVSGVLVVWHEKCVARVQGTRGLET